jgi:uncharacterized membrane protein YphA (DoxX/SURF4 family)
MWGLDKLVNVDHGVAVADSFYFGIGTSALFLNVFGVLEALLGVLVVLGLWRRRAYPVMFLILGVTAVAVWRSILDPWGWFIEGANVLFYPSIIIAAGAAMLWGTMDEDHMTLDHRMGGG